MTRTQLFSRIFLLPLLSAALVACGQSKAPEVTPATVGSSVDAQSPPGELDADPTPPPVPEPAVADGGDAGTSDADQSDAQPSNEPPSDAQPVDADQADTDQSDAQLSDERPSDADPSTDGPPATDDLCTRFCAVLLSTACAPDAAACKAGCTDDLAGTCAAEARADYACEAQLTAANYTCDSRGHSRLNRGMCNDEETTFGDCLLDAGP